MDGLVSWCGFLGAWLLFAGPLAQAVLELQDEDVEMDRLRAMADEHMRPEPVSPWWLLLPPVWFWRRHQRRERVRQTFLAHLSEADYSALSHFMDTARGWLYVAGGALLIAIKETWDLVHEHEWSDALFWVLISVLTFVAAGNTVVQTRRRVRGRA